MSKKRLVMLIGLLAIVTLMAFPFATGCSEPTTPTTTAPTTTAPTTTAPTTTAPTTTAPTTTEPTPTATEPEETYELKWLLTNTGYDEDNWGWKSCMGGGWAREIEYLSNGRVTFDYLIGAVTPFDMYDTLVQGGGDVAQNVIMLNPGRYPAMELMTVPDLFSQCQRPSQVAYNLWKTFPEIQNEFSEIKMLAAFATTPSPPGIGFAMVDKKVTTLEEADGVKMGIYGQWATKVVQSLGFTAVAVPNSEVYEALQRGVVDGSFMDTDFLSNQNVGELVEYWCPMGLLYCPFYCGLNWDTWNSLPPDIQKMMEDVAVNIPDWADYYLRQDKVRIMAEWPDLQVYQIAEDEQARWLAAQDPVQEEFFAELDSKGIDGRPVFDEMNRLFEVYKDELPESEIPEKQAGSL